MILGREGGIFRFDFAWLPQRIAFPEKLAVLTGQKS